MKAAALSLRIRAEAAAWLVGLRSADRTSDVDERFRGWLAECEAHRIAWERQSEAWELAGGLRGRFEARRESAADQPSRGHLSLGWAIAAVLSAGFVAVLILTVASLRPPAVTTTRGERRVFTLPDGSRVTLNTSTRITVEYGDHERRVRLDRGEALFDVKRNPAEPFTVVAGTREVRALGTAFEVRRTGDRVSVTLVEGRISVLATSDADVPRPQEVTVLVSPGQRVTLVPHEIPKVDHPVLQQVIAWQSGEVVFNDTPLPDAAREMNRYSERQIIVEGPGIEALRVGGLFQADASAEFAQAIAETFGLDLRQEGDRIVLSRPAATPAVSGGMTGGSSPPK